MPVLVFRALRERGPEGGFIGADEEQRACIVGSRAVAEDLEVGRCEVGCDLGEVGGHRRSLDRVPRYARGHRLDLGVGAKAPSYPGRSGHYPALPGEDV